ncbi:hypothetical protein EX30DRAFT_398825 [Ascodesmis nigricans]|uniref:Uncharacterized protein n=1 Tax=Ascodesmis nigricans TaxID=341454 RepID=A0A4S2MJM5_9PEZI|nr:hypothetical protein EX30DRAFT_398825 [Ascodesmis nigricans]
MPLHLSKDGLNAPPTSLGTNTTLSPSPTTLGLSASFLMPGTPMANDTPTASPSSSFPVVTHVSMPEPVAIEDTGEVNSEAAPASRSRARSFAGRIVEGVRRKGKEVVMRSKFWRKGIGYNSPQRIKGSPSTHRRSHSVSPRRESRVGVRLSGEVGLGLLLPPSSGLFNTQQDPLSSNAGNTNCSNIQARAKIRARPKTPVPPLMAHDEEWEDCDDYETAEEEIESNSLADGERSESGAKHHRQHRPYSPLPPTGPPIQALPTNSTVTITHPRQPSIASLAASLHNTTPLNSVRLRHGTSEMTLTGSSFHFLSDYEPGLRARLAAWEVEIAGLEVSLLFPPIQSGHGGEVGSTAVAVADREGEASDSESVKTSDTVIHTPGAGAGDAWVNWVMSMSTGNSTTPTGNNTPTTTESPTTTNTAITAMAGNQMGMSTTTLSNTTTMNSGTIAHDQELTINTNNNIPPDTPKSPSSPASSSSSISVSSLPDLPSADLYHILPIPLNDHIHYTRGQPRPVPDLATPPTAFNGVQFPRYQPTVATDRESWPVLERGRIWREFYDVEIGGVREVESLFAGSNSSSSSEEEHAEDEWRIAFLFPYADDPRHFCRLCLILQHAFNIPLWLTTLPDPLTLDPANYLEPELVLTPEEQARLMIGVPEEEIEEEELAALMGYELLGEDSDEGWENEDEGTIADDEMEMEIDSDDEEGGAVLPREMV